jgi:hypothetical protein
VKALDLVMAALFLYAVAVQYNDPDPVVWVVIYGVAAIQSGVIAFRPLPTAIPAITALVALPWAGTLAVRVIGRQSLIDSEEGREMLGLLIVAAWMAFLAARARRARTKGP